MAPFRILPRLLSAVLVPVFWVLLSAAENGTGSADPLHPAEVNSTQTRGNSTQTRGSGGSTGKGPASLDVDSSMIRRALYVLVGITTAGVLYFLIRAVRMKRPPLRKKYGLLSNQDELEMDQVESDEDDTLYEARSLRR